MFHRPLVPILLAFISGITAVHLLIPGKTDFIPYLCLIIGLLITLLLVTKSKTKILFLIILFLSLGALSYLTKCQPSVLQTLAEQQQLVKLEGVILQPPKVNKQRARFVVRLSLIFGQARQWEVSEKVLVTVYRFQQDFSPGDRVRFPARLKPFYNFNNPGRYDYELAMKTKGIVCAASISDGRYIVFMGRGSLSPLLDSLEQIRRPIRNLFGRLPSSDKQALYSALLLGERQGIHTMMREAFNRTGLGHLLAVSGLHIGLVAWFVFFIIKKILSFSYQLSLKVNIHKLAALLSCFPVIFYTGLTGFQTSSLRAMIMVLTYLMSIILGRERDVWSTLALAGLVILGIDPYSLFTISFQLSFLAVIGILWLTPIFLNLIPDSRLKTTSPGIFFTIYQYFLGLIMVTISATIFLLPITSFYFHRLSIVSIPANLMTVPILGLWILPLGLASILCLPFSEPLSAILLHLGAWGLDIMMAIIRFWSEFDFSAFWVITPNRWEIILYYGFIFFLFLYKKRSWAKFCLGAVLLFISFDIGYWIYQTRFNPALRVTYLDVGQGNAALVRFPGNKRMLIDAGGFRGGSFDTGRMIIAPYLWQLKIKKIDYLVLSHPQTDHMGGLGFLAAHFKPREFWWNGDKNESKCFIELMRVIDSKGIRKRLPKELRKKIKIGETEIRLLHPLPPELTTSPSQDHLDLNNNSMVLKITYEGESLLFPGDLEERGERIVTDSVGSELSSQILLAPHHGSKTSSTKGFLDKVNPKLCIISSGRNNVFNFPHQETMERLEQTRCKILRINQVGAIQLKLNKEETEVRSFLRGKEAFSKIVQ